MHMISDSGLDIGQQFYRLVVEESYRKIRGTGHVLFMAGFTELYMKWNTDGEIADEEITLGIAAVKVLNDESNHLGQLMKHVTKTKDDIAQLFEPNATDKQKVDECFIRRPFQSIALRGSCFLFFHRCTDHVKLPPDEGEQEEILSRGDLRRRARLPKRHNPPCMDAWSAPRRMCRLEDP